MLFIILLDSLFWQCLNFKSLIHKEYVFRSMYWKWWGIWEVEDPCGSFMSSINDAVQRLLLGLSDIEYHMYVDRQHTETT